MEYDLIHDCFVSLANLPGSVKGCCTVVGEDNLILINESLNAAARIATYHHELEHLHRGDLYSEKSVRSLEDETT